MKGNYLLEGEKASKEDFTDGGRAGSSWNFFRICLFAVKNTK